MSSIRKTAGSFLDVKTNVKIVLSGLWVALMLMYIYADILGFYSPGVIDKVVAGEIGGVQITDGFLFIMAVWMAVPSVMVFLSLVLKASANRWTNIIAGIISILMLVATFFAGEISARYIFQALIEAVILVMIVGYAWNWPKTEARGS